MTKPWRIWWRGLMRPASRPDKKAPAHDAADGEHEKPEELRRPQPQVFTQEHRRGQHIEKHAVERDAAGQHQRHETRALGHLPIAAHEVAGFEGLTRCGVQGLGQPAPHAEPQQRAQHHQQPEDGMPVGMRIEKTADQRRHRRRDAEIDGHLRHHALRIGRREHVPDDRARDHHAGARRHALQRAEEHQLGNRLAERTAHGRQREHRHPGQHHRASAQAVGERAVEEVHHRKAQQIAGQRLLHLHRGCAQRGGDARERRQVGVYRERPEHAQAGQQQRECPARPGHSSLASGFIVSGSNPAV